MTAFAQIGSGAKDLRRETKQQFRMEWFDWLMIFASLMAIGSTGYWKVQGPIILAASVIFCSIYAAYGLFAHGIKFKSNWLIAWSIIGIVHVGLSYQEWLPGNPTFYLREYVLRMGYFTFSLLPITAAFYVMFERVHRTIGLTKLATIGLASMAVAAIITYLYPVYDGHWMVEGSTDGLFSTVAIFLNYSINAIGIVFWWSLLALVRNSRVGMAIAIVAMFLSASAQMNVLGAIVLLVWASKQPLHLARSLGVIIIFGFPLAAVSLVAFGEQLGIDPNTVHRAQWWVEALAAVANNGGIALGFGADSTSDFALDDRFNMLGKWGNLPIHVIHNDFIYSLYSMGLIGCILLIIFHFKSILPVKMYDLSSAKHAAVIFLMVCLTTSVNSSFVSPQISIGLCWAYAYLLLYNKKEFD